MILKVDAIIGRRVKRTTRKEDEIRRKGNGEREETGRPVGVPMCYHEVDQPGLFEWACGPTMPTSGERPRRTSLVHYILYTFSCGRRGCTGGIPRRSAVDSIEGCFTGRAVERRWSALMKIRNVASSAESRNIGPYLCLIGDEVGTEVPLTEVWRRSLYTIDLVLGFRELGRASPIQKKHCAWFAKYRFLRLFICCNIKKLCVDVLYRTMRNMRYLEYPMRTWLFIVYFAWVNIWSLFFSVILTSTD